MRICLALLICLSLTGCVEFTPVRWILADLFRKHHQPQQITAMAYRPQPCTPDALAYAKSRIELAFPGQTVGHHPDFSLTFNDSTQRWMYCGTVSCFDDVGRSESRPVRAEVMQSGGYWQLVALVTNNVGGSCVPASDPLPPPVPDTVPRLDFPIDGPVPTPSPAPPAYDADPEADRNGSLKPVLSGRGEAEIIPLGWKRSDRLPGSSPAIFADQ